MNTTKTQTADNNETLRHVRELMGHGVYQTFAATYNEQGEKAALEYLSQFFGKEGWSKRLKAIPQTQIHD